jgi:spoIIIJ-associated protein
MKIEATGKTVDVAIENALKKSGLTIDQVETEVISEGGFLKQCKVAITKKLTEGEQVKQFLENVLEKMGFTKTVVEMNEDKDTIYVNLVGTESGVIGYRGEVLDALQYLSSLALNSKKCFKRIVLDSEGYREKREKTLIQLAKNLEQKVKRTGKAVKLEPMNPYERRIIHTTLQDSKYVSTESDGVMNNRHVVISPKLTNNILNAPSNGRKNLNFVYRSEKKKRR